MAKKPTAFSSPAKACHVRKATAADKAAAKRAKGSPDAEESAETKGTAAPSRVRAARDAETGSSK